MSKTRAPYPPEFRQQLVELLRAGRTPESLASLVRRGKKTSSKEGSRAGRSGLCWLAESLRRLVIRDVSFQMAL